MNDQYTGSDQSDVQDDTPYHVTNFDPASDCVSDELISGISTLTDADVTDLEPLATSVDTDALDDLFQPRANSARRDSNTHVRFAYAGYLVHIHSEGTITFYESDRETSG